jgi:hypothetical protein
MRLSEGRFRELVRNRNQDIRTVNASPQPPLLTMYLLPSVNFDARTETFGNMKPAACRFRMISIWVIGSRSKPNRSKCTSWEHTLYRMAMSKRAENSICMRFS